MPDDVPEGFGTAAPLAAGGRSGGFVSTTRGRTTLSAPDLAPIVDAVESAERGLVIAGPADPLDLAAGAPVAIASLAAATGFPLLADSLSGVRFGEQVTDGGHADAGVLVCGGYDAYLDRADDLDWPDPDLVLRFGASPTSKALQEYLADSGARQLLVDPAGDWREATFTATEVVEADAGWLASALADRLAGGEAGGPGEDWTDRFRHAEAAHWAAVDAEDRFFEGAILSTVLAEAPDPATVFVSNSMPVRDADRFGEPDGADLTVLGNRGASGVDGITSTALGAGSATDDPLVLVTGDLAYYHDTNGLLALSRCAVDATIVLLDNDGGGIFTMLPIADHDAFEDWFVTPHGLDFAPTADLYDLEFARVDSVDGFRERYGESVDSEGTQVICVESDAEASFQVRAALAEEVVARLGGD